MIKDVHKKCFRIILIIGCILFIASYFTSHQNEFALIFEIDVKYCLMLFILAFCILLTNGLKFFIIFKEAGLQNCPYKEWFKIFVVSNFVNAHVTQGANLYRGIKLKKVYDFTYTDSISSLTFVVWIETLSAFFFSTLILLIFSENASMDSQKIITFFAFIITLLCVVPFLCKGLVDIIQIRNKKIYWFLEKMRMLFHQITTYFRNPLVMIKLVFLNLIGYILYLSFIDICFQAIDADIKIEALALFTIILLLSRLITVVPGNLGVTEIMSGYLAKLLGGSMGNGMIVAGLLRIIIYISNAVLGMMFAKSIFVNKIIEKEP